MARSVSLATIRQRVRRRAGIEGEVTCFPDSDLNDEINESLANLYDVIRKAFGSDYFQSTSTIAATAGIATYSLPADFLSLESIDVTFAGGITASVFRYMQAERNMYKAVPWVTPTMSGSSMSQTFYRLVGSNITFIPTPTSAMTFTMVYVQTAPRLISDADTFDGINGWEEFIALDAAIRILLKDGESDLIKRLEDRLAQATQRVIDLAHERDSGEPDHVPDVAGRYGGPF